MRTAHGLAAALAFAGAAAGCSSPAADPAGPAAPSSSFHARQAFAVTPPADASVLRCWFSLPQNDEAQEVSNLTILAPVAYDVVGDDQGNWFLYLEAKGPGLAPFEVVQEFDLVRREVSASVDPKKSRPLTDAERKEHAADLAPNTYIPVNDAFRKTALEATGGDTNPVSASRKLYDWTLKNIEYWVKYPDKMKASPTGNAEYCMTGKTGNCTDFHSLWTALARSAGIPTRMVYGSFFKKELAGKDADQSYHCWIEFWAPGIGWIPHDVAVADIFVGDFALNEGNAEKVRLTTADGYTGKDPAKVDWYFGNIDSRRVVWHRGRDLKIEKGPAGGPVNMLPKAVVEADGKPVKEKEGWTRKLTFEERK